MKIRTTRLRRLTIFIALSILPLFFVEAQNAKIKKMEDEADQYFRFDRNYEALEIYLKLDSIRPDDPKTIARIGICYLYYIKSKALPYLEKAKSLNYKEDHLTYYLARAYHLTHQFDKAIPLYNESKKELRSKLVRQDIDLYIKNCNDAKMIMKDSIKVRIINLGPGVNSEYSEYAPIITADESMLIFTAERPTYSENGKQIYLSEDIYISKNENGVWQKSESIGEPINSKGNDASIALSMDGEEIFIYKSDPLNPSGGHIYVSKKDGDSWTKPAMMNSNINSDGWDPSISIDAKEDIVFFSSNREGGYGGLDIYVSKKTEDNKWGPAKNLGPLINTAYDEDAPFIHPDGKTLYFSSKGHPSIGGFDIYTTIYSPENDSVTPPQNVGYPINTADDEIFFIWSADGTRGYFSSAREDTYGRNDIYVITRPDVEVDLILFSGIVSTTDNKKVAASIIITDNETNEVVGVYDSTKFVGKFAISLTPGKNYGISIEAKNYLTYSENINIPVNGFHDIKKDIKLVPLEKGGLIVLKNVLFDPGKAELKEGSIPELERYLNLIKENPNFIVEIAGHAFDLEDHRSNLELSEKRAKAVVDYLVKNGGKQENLRAVGYGDKYKVVDDDKSLNTRTELIIREALVQANKQEVKQGYYYQEPEKAIAQSKQDVNNSITARQKLHTDYLVKKDEDIYFGVNTATNLKELKVIEEVKEKVQKGILMPVVLKGKITEATDGIGLNSLIYITNEEGKRISETKTSKDGIYNIEIFGSKEKKYTITVQSSGYNFSSKNVVAPANGSKKKEIINNFELSRLNTGSKFILHNIYFDFNKATIKKESFKELKKLEVLMRKNPNLKIQISGHTDIKGTSEYNQILSQQRAESVVKYLIGHGIAGDRLIAKGYGASRPMASNDDEDEGRELNRRIEFEVLQK